MGMSVFYGTTDEDESVATIHRAIELGITFLDMADMYGPFTNEKLVGKAIAGRRDEVVLATKFGNVRGGRCAGRTARGPTKNPAHRAAVANDDRLDHGRDQRDLARMPDVGCEGPSAPGHRHVKPWRLWAPSATG